MELCYIEGEFLLPESAKLPVTDLVIQRGVGIFEAFGTIEGRPLMMTSHLERLLSSADSMNIHPELLRTRGREYFLAHVKAIIREGIARVRKKFKLKPEVSVKIYLTGGDIFDAREGFITPRLLVIFERLLLPPKAAYENGVSLTPLKFGREAPSVKSVDYRAAYTGTGEVLYCPDGEITEAGHSSFFLVYNYNRESGHARLITAPLSRVLAGTTRRVILELARSAREPAIEIQERCPLVSELPRASEAFITGSTKQVVPVTRIGDITIGDGRPGPVTKYLADLYRARIRALLE